MENFFEKLKEFVESYRDSDTKDLFFEFHGSKITYRIAEEIHYRVIQNECWHEELVATLDEKCDYIRLLRDENERLRGDRK